MRTSASRRDGYEKTTPSKSTRPSTSVELGAGGVHDRRGPVHQLEDAVGGAARLHEVGPDVAEAAQREADEQRVHEELGEIAPAQLRPSATILPPYQRTAAHAETAAHAATPMKVEPMTARAARQLERSHHRRAVALHLARLGGEGAHGADAAERLLGDLAGAGQRVLHVARELADAAPVGDRAERDGRDHGEHQRA